MINFHPSNIFISRQSTDPSSDILLTDVGLAYIPRYSMREGVYDSFIAPELLESQIELVEVTDRNPGKADVYALGKMCLMLAAGAPGAE